MRAENEHSCVCVLLTALHCTLVCEREEGGVALSVGGLECKRGLSVRRGVGVKEIEEGLSVGWTFSVRNFV